MRALILVFCLATTAYAASLGYDYSQQQQQQQYQPAATESGHGSSIAPGSEHGASELSQAVEPAGEYTKEFFTYTAPEGDFNDVDNANQLANSLKKSLRVVFIKGPESSGLENAALNLAKAASDDRTAIYVLNKQADIGDLANKLNQLNSHNANKPEVHFVKYRTNADADHAQRAIEAQYGGATNSHNGGVAPVLDFASKAAPQPAASNQHTSYGAPSVAAAAAAADPSGAYLPPNRRF